MVKVRNWTRSELVVAFNYYCRTPFGKFHSRNPEIIGLGRLVGRSSGAVAMKLVNFASLDPTLKARNVSGLANASKLDKEVWDEFHENWESLAYESELAVRQLCEKKGVTSVDDTFHPPIHLGATTRTAEVRVRLVQTFFRRAVLASFDEKCAFCGLDSPDMLNASHIIPWSKNTMRRADPSNGLCLCALHDRAFDRGFVTVSDAWEIVISSAVYRFSDLPIRRVAFDDLNGRTVTRPVRFEADTKTLRYHRKSVFLK